MVCTTPVLTASATFSSRVDVTDRLIEQLSSDSFAERQTAYWELLQLLIAGDEYALVALKEAYQFDPDPEVRFRADNLLSYDYDGDGLTTKFELFTSNSSPFDRDTDDDWLNDNKEWTLGTNPSDPDTDGDGLDDCVELNYYPTDPKNPDTDGDGFSDGDEVAAGSSPNNPVVTPENISKIIKAASPSATPLPSPTPIDDEFRRTLAPAPE